MYRTLIIALASTAALCGVADAQVAGSVTGNVNATLESSRIPVDPRTGRPLSRLEITRAQREARLARRQAAEIADEDALAGARDPLATAALDDDGLKITQIAEAPDAPTADGLGLGLAEAPAPASIDVRTLAPLPSAREPRIAAPVPAVTAAAPSLAVAAAASRPVYEQHTVIYREDAEPAAATRRAAHRAPVSVAATPPAQAAPQPSAPARVDASTSGSDESAAAPDWIAFLLAGLAIASVILAARRASSRRNAAA